VLLYLNFVKSEEGCLLKTGSFQQLLVVWSIFCLQKEKKKEKKNNTKKPLDSSAKLKPEGWKCT